MKDAVRRAGCVREEKSSERIGLGRPVGKARTVRRVSKREDGGWGLRLISVKR